MSNPYLKQILSFVLLKFDSSCLTNYDVLCVCVHVCACTCVWVRACINNINNNQIKYQNIFEEYPDAINIHLVEAFEEYLINVVNCLA